MLVQHSSVGRALLKYIPGALRTVIQYLSKDPTLYGHPTKRRMYDPMIHQSSWRYMQKDVHMTVEDWRSGAKYGPRVKFNRNLQLFPATTPLQFVSINTFEQCLRTMSSI